MNRKRFKAQIWFILMIMVCKFSYSQLWHSAKTFTPGNTGQYEQVELFNDNFLLRSLNGHTTTLTMIDTAASTIWTKTYPGLKFSNIQIEDDSIWCAGYFSSNVQISNQSYTSTPSSAYSFIAVLDSTGNIIRYRVFNSSPFAIRGMCVKNNFLHITGQYSKNLNLDTISLQGDSVYYRMIVATFNKSFITLKAKNTEGGLASGFCVKADKNNALYLLAEVETTVMWGNNYLSDPNGDYCTDDGEMLIKLDQNYNIIWKKVIHPGVKGNMHFPEIHLDSLNNCTIRFLTPGGSGALHLTGIQKHDSNNGAKLWSFGFGTGNGIYAQDQNDNFYSVGHTSSNHNPSRFSVGKINPNGSMSFVLLDTVFANAQVILAINENDFYTIGTCYQTNDFCENNSSLLLRYKFPYDVSVSELAYINNEISLYPNPTTGICSLKSKSPIKKIKVINSEGQTVKIVLAPNFSTSTSINLNAYDKGVYCIQVTTDVYTSCHKLVLN